MRSKSASLDLVLTGSCQKEAFWPFLLRRLRQTWLGNLLSDGRIRQDESPQLVLVYAEGIFWIKVLLSFLAFSC